MGIATVAVWLTDIVINQAFPIVRDTFGVSAMFLGCAVFLAIQFVVVARKLPETKGLPLEDILSLWSRSEEHTSELQSLMRTSYAVFCLKKKKNKQSKQYLTPQNKRRQRSKKQPIPNKERKIRNAKLNSEIKQNHEDDK